MPFRDRHAGGIHSCNGKKRSGEGRAPGALVQGRTAKAASARAQARRGSRRVLAHGRSGQRNG
jgi:hypothetical protein